MSKAEVMMPHAEAVVSAPVVQLAVEVVQSPQTTEIDPRGEFPRARAVLMGISEWQEQACWEEYDSRLGRVQELDQEFVARMTGIFPSQELTAEDIAEMTKRNLGVVNAISKTTLGQFVETRRDDSTIQDIGKNLETVRIAQASVMLGIEENAGIEAVRQTICRRLPEDIPEQELMSVYAALGIPQHYQRRA